MVEWSEPLVYGTESLQKVASSNPGLASGRPENSLFQPSSKRVSVSNQENIRKRKRRDGLHLSHASPMLLWASTPHCPFGHKTKGNHYL